MKQVPTVAAWSAGVYECSGGRVERFVEKENIALFQRRLREEPDAGRRRLLLSLLKQSQSRLAVIEAKAFGAHPAASMPDPVAYPEGVEHELDALFRSDFERSDRPLLLIDPRPGLRIVDANAAYVAATMIERDKVKGRPLFEVFPDNPDDPVQTGVANLFASLTEVTSTGQPHAMDVQRYDVRDTSGVFVERYWQPLNTPLFDSSGKLVLILHQVIDVTAEVRGQQGNPPAPSGASPRN